MKITLTSSMLAGNNVTECPICMESFNEGQEIIVHDVQSASPLSAIGHAVHEDCQKRCDRASVCTTCREPYQGPLTLEDINKELREHPGEANFAGALCNGLDLKGLDFTGANFTAADLRNTDFSDATLLRVNITEAKLDGMKVSFEGLNDLVFYKTPREQLLKLKVINPYPASSCVVS